MPRFALSRRSRWYSVVIGIAVGALLAAAAIYGPSLLGAGGALEEGELVILTGSDTSVGRRQHELIDLWNATREVKARIVEVEGVADDHHSQMVADAQAARSEVDIFNLDLIWVAEFARFGWIRELDRSTVDTSGFLVPPRRSCEYDGKLWCLPFNTDAGLLFYRSDLLGAQPPPSTWADLEAQTATVLAARNDPPPTAGYAGQLADYEGLTVNALEAIWDAGGEVVDGAGRVVIDDDRYRNAVKTGLGRLARAQRTGARPVVHPDAGSFDEDATTQAFRNGQVVFMRNWPVAYRRLDAPPGEGTAARVGRFEVGRLPGPSALGGQNLAVAASTDQPRAAQALIEFLTSPFSQQILFERGGFAATQRIVYFDRTVQQNHPYAQRLLESVEGANLRPVTPHYARFSEEFRVGVRYAMEHSGQLPDGFADSLQAALDGRQPG
jgi:multiple sugar transport system substrate-binding protein